MVSPIIRVFLADGQPLFLETLADRLSRTEDIRVVGTATRGAALLEQALRTPVDVLLLETHFEDRDAFEVASVLRRRRRQLRLGFLTAFAPEVFIKQALKLNASFLDKSVSVDGLLAAIRQIAAGDLAFSPIIEERLIYNKRRSRYELPKSGPLSGLSPRQIEVLRYLARGDSVREVAQELHLSEKSIDSHKYRIMHKLDIHDRVQLARFAIREGLVLP